MTLRTTRRNVLLGAGAASAAAMMRPSRLIADDATPQRGGTFRLATPDFSSADRLDPQLNQYRFMINLQFQLRNGLVEIGPGGVLVPELATEWGPNADLTEWTFKIRSGVEFHDGRPLTAEDVVWSLNLHRGDATVSNAKALMLQVTDIRATGPLEVRFTLDSPNAGFPSILSLVQLLIVPAEDMDFDKGVGTGGYVLESYEAGVRSVVRRNPNYWKEGRAHFDSIEMYAISDVNARTTALQTGQIDAMAFVDSTTANLLAALPSINLIQTPGKLHYAFSMKTDDPLFADPNVRKAMKLAIDREDILKRVLSGYGTVANDQPISLAYPDHNPTLEQYAYDPDQARFLLERAGAAGLTAPLHVSLAPFPGAVNMAELFAQHAAAAGVTLQVQREPEDGYWTNIWGKRPLFATRWSGRVNEDVMLTLVYSRGSIGSWNETSWDNEAFNRLLVEARGEPDDARRREMYWECQRLIWDDGGMIAPMFSDFLDATSDRVGHGEIANDWDLDGGRAGERWWFKA